MAFVLRAGDRAAVSKFSRYFGEPVPRVRIHTSNHIKNPTPFGAGFIYLVELGGFEPPSAISPPSVLHA